MNTSSGFPAAAASTDLGVSGYTFADLHDPERLASLVRAVLRGSRGGRSRVLGASGTRIAGRPTRRGRRWRCRTCSIGMAPHVSRFVTRLFQVERRRSTRSRDRPRAQDDLFRFKIDFVRRRALPLLKGGAHVVSTPEDDAIVERADRPGASRRQRPRAGHRARRLRAAGSREGRRQPPRRSPQPEIESAEALVRRAAARSRVSPLGDLPLSRKRSTTGISSRCSSPSRRCPKRCSGPTGGCAVRDGFKLTDARMNAARGAERDSLLRALPRARQGLLLEGAAREGRQGRSSTRSASSSTAVRSTRRFPRCTRCGRPATPSARSRSSSLDNPMCPGTGHRICNDCMKSCIYQKQEPVNIPQIETGVLTDVLSMPWGVEIYGLLTRWNPLNVRRPYALPYNGKNVLVVGLGPAGYTLAHYLVNEGFGVVGIDGLKIEPLPEDIVGTDTAPPRPIRDWSEIYRPARRARARRVRRRVRVRHHRPLGQELPDAAAPDAARGARACGCTAASASAARCRSKTRGRTGSITSRSRPAPAGRRSST